ncbi:MAG: O-antigen polysaccharide polymerase Wzy family protein [Oscillospiraceae bacterium]|nr:O-antigen polysaccharide polymerase Wzy family protein [Oscillospiraceae bacterium]
MMKIKVNTIGLIFLVAGFFLILLGMLFDSPQFYTYVTLVYWVIGVVYSLLDIRHNFPLFSYNVGFFFFLLGGYFIDFLKEGNFSYFLDSSAPASDNAVKHTCFCLMLTSVVINATYIAFSKKKDYVTKVRIDNNTSKVFILRKILVLLLVLTYACDLYCSITDMIFVRSVSYRDSMMYLSNTSVIIVSLSSLYYILLFIYWATLPPKWPTIISILSLILTGTFNLIAGDRGGFISSCLVICYFILFRNKFGLCDIVIKKKVVFVAILLIPFVMHGLQAISYIRNNQDYEENVVDGMASFIYTQGGSVRIIAEGYDLDAEINDLVGGKRSFTFGEIKRYMKSNIFTRVLTGESKSLRTIEDAQSGESFQQSYGYILSPYAYFRQVGGGSTYIAEVYYDGGYIFLCIFNLFIVFLLLKMGSGGSNSIIGNAIMFNIIRFIPLLPRGIAFKWFTDTFAIQNLIVFLAVWLFLHEKSTNKAPKIYNTSDNTYEDKK